MLIFIPKEIKQGEGRVALTPEHAARLSNMGATIYMEKSAGNKSGYEDVSYADGGIFIETMTKDRFDSVINYYFVHTFKRLRTIILKVKEVTAREYNLILPGVPVVSFGHLASNETLTKLVIERGGTYLSLEDIVENGKRPVLMGMSKIAGEEAVEIGIRYLTGKKFQPFIVGYGNVGKAAQKKLNEIGAVPIIYDKAKSRAEEKNEWNLSGQFHLITNVSEMLRFVFEAIHEIVKRHPDRNFEEPILLILAPYIPEQSAPKIIYNDMLKLVPTGSVIVDVSIDQGGACEFSQVTSHANPCVELERGIKYFGIPNLPGGVPARSTPVFSETVFPYMRQIVNKGFIRALKEDRALSGAVSIYNGKVTSRGLAETFGLEYVPIESLL